MEIPNTVENVRRKFRSGERITRKDHKILSDYYGYTRLMKGCVSGSGKNGSILVDDMTTAVRSLYVENARDVDSLSYFTRMDLFNRSVYLLASKVPKHYPEIEGKICFDLDMDTSGMSQREVRVLMSCFEFQSRLRQENDLFHSIVESIDRLEWIEKVRMFARHMKGGLRDVFKEFVRVMILFRPLAVYKLI